MPQIVVSDERSQSTTIDQPTPGTDDRPVVEAPADDGRVIATSWRSVLPTAAEVLRARRRLHGKSILIALLLAGSYWAVVLSELGWPFRLIGGASLVVGLVALATGVMHDGNHGSFSRHAWLNHVAGYSLDALGGSSWLWRFKHNTLHHGNPNVEGVDSDISQAPFARLAPMQPLRRWHRWQHVYLWFLYGFFALKNLVFGDFRTLAAARIGPKALRTRPGPTVARPGTRRQASASRLGRRGPTPDESMVGRARLLPGELLAGRVRVGGDIPTGTLRRHRRLRRRAGATTWT